MGIEIHGRVVGPFWRVARALERQLERSGGGAAAAVYYKGEKVVDVWGGVRDEDGRPWEEDTMAMSFSTSKGVVATLAHILADRGLLDYDAPIAEYWPEFAEGGKHSITVRDALTHRSGLAPIRTLIDHEDRLLDWEHMVRAIERAKARPRRYSAYHALTFGWLVGELVQRVAGATLPELLERELAGPLGLDGLFIGAPPEARARAAQLIGSLTASSGGGGVGSVFASQGLIEGAVTAASWIGRWTRLPVRPGLTWNALVPPGPGEVFSHPRILDVPIPAANGLFTARSLARMYAAIAGGGRLDGVELFSPRTAARIGQLEVKTRDYVINLPMHWRLGYHGVFTTRGRVHEGFGHFGFGGSGAWADPSRRLAVAMVNNRVGGSPFGDGRIAWISSAAMQAASVARRRERERLRPVPASPGLSIHPAD